VIHQDDPPISRFGITGGWVSTKQDILDFDMLVDTPKRTTLLYRVFGARADICLVECKTFGTSYPLMHLESTGARMKKVIFIGRCNLGWKTWNVFGVVKALVKSN